MLTALYILFILSELLFAILIFTYMSLALYSSFMGSAYVPTKDREVDRVLKEAHLKQNQIFYDLGCGDGRVVRLAVSKYRVRGIGIDINPALIFLSRFKCRIKKIENIEFRRENLLNADFKSANIIYLFLMPELLKKLAPKIISNVKKGTLIISHAFKIESFQKYQINKIDGKPFPTYYYKIPQVDNT